MGKEKSSSSSVLQAHYSEIKEELLMPDIVINQPSFTSPSKTKGNIGAIGSFEHADEGNVQHAQLHHNDIVEADSNEVAKELELPDQRVSHGEVAKFVLPDSQSHIPGVENEAQRSDSKDQDDMLLPLDLSSPNCSICISTGGAVDKTILKLGDRKKATNKNTVKKFGSIHSIQETEIQLMALRKMRDIDKCVDTSDLDFDPDDYVQFMRLRNKQMSRRFSKRRSTLISHTEAPRKVSDEEVYLEDAPSQISSD